MSRENFIQRFIKRRQILSHYKKHIENRNISLSDLDRLMDAQISGNTFGEGTALNYSAWFNGVQQISQTIASLDLFLFIKEGDKKRFYIENPLYNVLLNRTNSFMDAFLWKETMMNHVINMGNSYSRIIKDNGNRIRSLVLLDPARMWKIELTNQGTKKYYYSLPQGGSIIYEQDEIFHVAGLGYDGIQGYPVLTLARRSINIGLKFNQFTETFLDNSTSLGGVLEYPGKLSKEATERLKNTISSNYSGSGKAGKVMVLQDGMKYNALGMPLEDAQFLESKTWQISDIARWLNMPPHKLKDLSNATYDNITSEQISYLQDTIRPWLERIEKAIDTQLISKMNENKSFAEFNTEALLRTDIKTRNEAFQIDLEMGSITPNQIRAAKGQNMSDDPALDQYYMKNNIVAITGDQAQENIDENDI